MRIRQADPRLIAGIAALVGAALFAALAANEITVTAYLDVDNGSFDLTRNVSQLQIDQTGNYMGYGVIGVNTTTNPATQIVLPTNVVTAGYAFFRNVGTANQAVFIASGASATTNALLRLDTNQVAIAPLASTSVVAWTTNGTTFLEYWINER